MKQEDLARILRISNRLHKVKLFARKMTPKTLVIWVRIGEKRVSLGLPSIPLTPKGMSIEESYVIKQAEQKRNELEAVVDSGSLGAAKMLYSKGRKKLSEVMAEWANSFTVYQTKKNAEMIRARMTECLKADIPVAALKREHFVDLISYLKKKGDHINTVRYNLSRLRAFMNWAADRGYLARVSTRNLLPAEQFGEVKALTTDELVKLTRTPIEKFPDVKDRFLFGVFTCQRMGEISGYRWRILEDGCISVRQGKTGKFITVPLSSQARTLLESIKARKKSTGPDDLIFDELPTSPTARRWFDRWLAEAGIEKEKVDPHNSRSTGISLLINLGVSQDVLQEIANHSNPATTARYYRRVDQKRKVAALESMPVIIPVSD